MFFKRVKASFSTFFRLFRVSLQVVRSVWRFTKIEGPFVSVFGGARLPQNHPYASKVQELSARLVKEGISVITGGGPGVMYAANCGAKEEGSGKSIGVGVRGLEAERRNPCMDEYFELNYFFARKWMLTRFSETFVIFPGGFGTIDELSEILTLMKTKKLKKVPIVLFGKEYWTPLIKWVDTGVSHDLISKEYLKLFILTDDLEEVFCIARDECKI